MVARVKWFLAGALLAALAILYGSLKYNAERERTETLRAENERLAGERRELAKVVERLNVENRVADVEVLEQRVDPAGVVQETVLRWTEIGRSGQPIPAELVRVPGGVPYFDAVVVKFDNDYVAHGDALRGKSLALFRRIYDETQAPDSGYWIGNPGNVPDVYRVADTPSDFEINLWQEFWQYAADPEKARAAGVRVAQGEAVYAPVSVGQRWTLTLEANGGLNLVQQANGPAPTASPPSGIAEKS